MDFTVMISALFSQYAYHQTCQKSHISCCIVYFDLAAKAERRVLAHVILEEKKALVEITHFHNVQKRRNCMNDILDYC
jgi:sulfur transfer complex TusBCD TusB component (DsrH family)